MSINHFHLSHDTRLLLTKQNSQEEIIMTCLVDFCQLHINLDMFGKNFNWENAPNRLPLGKSVGHFLDEWFMLEGPAHYGRWHPWAGVPEVYEDAKRTCQQVEIFPGSASVPASSFCMTFLNDKLWHIIKVK